MKLLPCLCLVAACDASAAFRDEAEHLAARTDRHVIAWGDAPLGEDDLPRRFAVLEPDDRRYGRGAYLIEDAPGQRGLVSFAMDGRTELWGLGATHDDDTWQHRDERAIEHGQSHRHGGEEIAFALRDDELVVLRHQYVDDAETEVIERQRFAPEDVCLEPCPPLRTFETFDFDLQVDGPMR